MDKPLFIPLKSEFFHAFEVGQKTEEIRCYGARWNENTCYPGRTVILSLGYGKHHRLAGVVTKFRKVKVVTIRSKKRLLTLAELFGELPEFLAIISIKMNSKNSVHE